MSAACAQRLRAPPFIDPSGYAQHRPETTLLYRLVEQHYPDFRELRAGEGRSLPGHVQEEFDAYLKCGLLEEGFLRVRCEHCHVEKLVAFNCKKRGFCPSLGGRRMAETVALLADEVLPERPLSQWVLSLPFTLRFLLATERTVYRAIHTKTTLQGCSRITAKSSPVAVVAYPATRTRPSA
ncbi:MAG: transposase zinc-binding domain-containing protein [Proteobacteria bacterium]|nr:transposase zinc-binding domain-containing protein [Pseudomonadota bacterium]